MPCYSVFNLTFLSQYILLLLNDYTSTRVSCFITEPIGSRAPTFQSEFRGNMLNKPTGHSFALLCQAQAYPIPLMRLVTLEKACWCNEKGV